MKLLIFGPSKAQIGPTSQAKGQSHGDQTHRHAAVRQRPAEYFIGTVRIDPLNNPPEPARVSMALVTFDTD